MSNATAVGLHFRGDYCLVSGARCGFVELFHQLLVSVADNSWRPSAVCFGVGAGNDKATNPRR